MDTTTSESIITTILADCRRRMRPLAIEATSGGGGTISDVRASLASRAEAEGTSIDRVADHATWPAYIWDVALDCAESLGLGKSGSIDAADTVSATLAREWDSAQREVLAEAAR